MPAPDFRINWEEVRKKITPKTRLLLINSPQNPTGTVLAQSDLLELQEIVRGTNIVIISDEPITAAQLVIAPLSARNQKASGRVGSP